MLVTSFISVVLMANILIDQLHTLMNAQDFERAYAVALSQSENHQGDAAFDFYFGWAALETGHPDQAVIALERTLMINPDQPRARLELARAYSQLHQWDLAEEQLALVEKVNPPPAVLNNIFQFRQALQQGRKDDAHQWMVETTFGAGFDSNVNSSTREDTVQLGLLSLVINENQQAQDAALFESKVNAEWTYRTSPSWSWVSALRVNDRQYEQQEPFETTTLQGSFAPAWQSQKDQLRFPIVAQSFWLAGDPYRDSLGLNVEYLHAFSPKITALIFGGLNSNFYQDDQMDSDQSVFGIGAGGQFAVNSPWGWSASTFLGRDDAEIREWNSKDFLGIQMGLTRTWQYHQGSLQILSQDTEHREIDPIFNQQREDDFLSTRLQWDWSKQQRWGLRASVSFDHSESNVELYKYDRHQVVVSWWSRVREL